MIKKVEVFYFLSLSGLLWAYLIYKAVVSPLVMDEATTFLEYAHLWDVLPGQANWRTNNHYLNSILVALSTSIFGINEIALRLPNLLAFLIFARYTWFWNQNIQSGILRFLFPVTVFASLFYMEFFGLARGYGLSLAALYGGAYHQYRGLAENSSRDQKLSFMFMIFAITANLNMQFIYLVWFALEVWNRRKVLKSSLFYLAIRLVPILLTIVVSFILKSKGTLDSGHDLGLLETFKSLLFVVGGKWNFYWWSIPISLSVLVLLALVKRLKTVKESEWQAFDVLFILLIGNICVILLNHFVLGVTYPNQRLAMHWFILWLPLVFLAANCFNTRGNYLMAAIAILFIGFQFNYWNKSFSFNRNSDGVWKNEQIEDSFSKVFENMNDPEITLSGSFYHHRQWAFLQLKNDMDFPSRMQHSVFKDTLADFKLVKADQKQEHPAYELYKKDRCGLLSLLKRKTELSKKSVATIELKDAELRAGVTRLLQDYKYPTKGKQLGLRLVFNMHASKSKVKSKIEVLAINNKGFKYWEEIRLDKLYRDLKNQEVSLNVLVPSQNEDELNFLVNIVNIDGVKCSIDKARCYFYELE